MKIVFFGTSSFATPILLSLIRGRHNLLAVVTQPDRRSGRGLIRSFSPVKLIAQKYGLSLHQPLNVGNSDFVKILTQLNADIFVVAAFGQMLSKEVLEIPKHYSINVHPSLLPKYRGAAPMNWALLQGEAVTGVTIFRMTEGMDEGNIVVQKEINIDDEDTTLTLSDKLSKLGAELLTETLELIKKGHVDFIPQNEREATYAPKLKKKEGLINWSKTSKDVHNHVRGMIPWPTAYTYLGNALIKVWKTKLLEGHTGTCVEPGTVVDIRKEGIIVRTGDAAILICELQVEGKKKMSADAYRRGHKIEIEQKFS